MIKVNQTCICFVENAYNEKRNAIHDIMLIKTAFYWTHISMQDHEFISIIAYS